MIIKLIYKDNVVRYQEAGQEWYNRDRISVVTYVQFGVMTQENPTSQPPPTKLEFRHIEFIQVGKDLVKVMEEV